MRVARLFSLVALLPAVLGGVPAASGRTLPAPICSGDGAVRVVSIQLDEPRLPGSDPSHCSVKGCHAGSSRKKLCSDAEQEE